MNRNLEKPFTCHMSALLIGLVFASPAAQAEVSEVVSYRYYNATPVGQESMRQSLSRTSPIREKGKLFWGHTAWHVTWDFNWSRQNGGRCSISGLRTRVKATITLPQMDHPDAVQQKEFERFEKALRRHEMQHLAIVRDAASAIDQRLLKMPTMPSCHALEQALNARGQGLLDEARQRSLAFDQRTRHGVTEGASLKN